MAVGALGAIGLGIALIPLRSVTSASNLAFAFLIFTVVIAEVGGRAAGLATAVVAALSLNFFLTQPYLTLTIDRPDDIVAFAALAVSGLIAAAFGRRRARSAERAAETRRELDGLARLGDGLVGGQPLETVLEDLRRTFGLGGDRPPRRRAAARRRAGEPRGPARARHGAGATHARRDRGGAGPLRPPGPSPARRWRPAPARHAGRAAVGRRPGG